MSTSVTLVIPANQHCLIKKTYATNRSASAGFQKIKKNRSALHPLLEPEPCPHNERRLTVRLVVADSGDAPLQISRVPRIRAHPGMAGPY